jgi:hypothetical protein
VAVFALQVLEQLCVASFSRTKHIDLLMISAKCFENLCSRYTYGSGRSVMRHKVTVDVYHMNSRIANRRTSKIVVMQDIAVISRSLESLSCCAVQECVRPG